MVAGNLFLRGVDFARYIVIARLLAPGELGKFFLVAAILAAAEVTTQPGLEDALIQRRDRSERTWRASWTFLVLRGAVLSGIVVAIAGVLTSALDNPDVAPLLRVAALYIFLRSLRSLA